MEHRRSRHRDHCRLSVRRGRRKTGRRLRLVSDGTAEVWGLPWYRTTPGSCDEKDLEYVSATGKVSTIVDPLSSQLSAEFDLSKSPNDIVTAGRNFYRSNDFEGWQVLSYSSCILFNDGHNLVFHMVGQ